MLLRWFTVPLMLVCDLAALKFFKVNCDSEDEDDIPKKRPTPRKQLLVDSDDE